MKVTEIVYLETFEVTIASCFTGLGNIGHRDILTHDPAFVEGAEVNSQRVKNT